MIFPPALRLVSTSRLALLSNLSKLITRAPRPLPSLLTALSSLIGQLVMLALSVILRLASVAPVKKFPAIVVAVFLSFLMSILALSSIFAPALEVMSRSPPAVTLPLTFKSAELLIRPKLKAAAPLSLFDTPVPLSLALIVESAFMAILPALRLALSPTVRAALLERNR